MRGVNKVILVGHLGADPEIVKDGITKFSVATSEQWNDKATGNKQERTEWHRVVTFGKLADISRDYLRKGKLVYIEGSIRTDKYEDAQGVTKYSTSIRANNMQMLDSASQSKGDRPENSNPVSKGASVIKPAPYEQDIPF